MTLQNRPGQRFEQPGVMGIGGVVSGSDGPLRPLVGGERLGLRRWR